MSNWLRDPELEAAGYEIADAGDHFELGAGPFYARKRADGGNEIAIRVAERHRNSGGVGHGGMLMTMADLAVCYEAVGGVPGLQALTVSFTANFLAPARLGALLTVSPKIIRRTRRMAFVDAAIMDVDAGECVFTCTTVLRMIENSPGAPIAPAEPA